MNAKPLRDMTHLQLPDTVKAGDMIVLDYEPVEPEWTEMGGAWYRLATAMDAGRWVPAYRAADEVSERE